MAISCLMIEALESFWQGLEDTKGKSGEIFIDFFCHCNCGIYKIIVRFISLTYRLKSDELKVASEMTNMMML